MQVRPNGSYKRRSRCKDCLNRQRTEYHTKLSPERKHKIKSQFMKRAYGITPEEYNKMFTTQSGLCRGCKRPQKDFKKSLSVDHCHLTGKVRGLLCAGCNLALGYVKDNATTLLSLATYLRNS